MNLFSFVFLFALVAVTAVQLWLILRQRRHVTAHREKVPPAFADRISLEEHRRAADYTAARSGVALGETLFGAALLLGWTLGGGINAVAEFWTSVFTNELVAGVALVVSVFLISGLLELPFAAWRTFRVEERFGFNRTTPAVFAGDVVKQGVVSVLLGAPLAALVLWLMAHAGTAWWLWAWGAVIGFAVLMMWAYPALIAPLFNKFSPLEDQALETRIRRLLERTGFSFGGVMVMDGSRRSSHGNAYFTGMGGNKRIVFFDTLLERLSPEEIEAVLAHELGHFRRRHIRSRFIITASLSLIGLAVLGWLAGEPWFYSGLGVERMSLATALLLFLMVSPVFTFVIQPLLAWSMRRHEFEADEFAAEQADASDLVHALVKLYRENASTLTPDPLYSAVHDSHPPAPIRVAHLEQFMGKPA